MRVQAVPLAPLRSGTVRRSATGGVSAFREALGRARESEAPSEVAPTPATAALLAVQEVEEVEDAGERRRRALARAETLLDELEAVRDGLLAGQVSGETLRRLAETLRGSRDRIDDPRLAALLREVELRAAVELAKLERGEE